MSRSLIITALALTALVGCSGPSADGGGTSGAESRSKPGAPASSAPASGTAASGIAPVPAATTGSAGRRIFDNTCVACHQENGLGITGVYPSLAHSPVVLGDPAVLARWVVLGRRPDTMPTGRYSTQMPPFGWLKPEDAASLLSYIRASFGNSAPAVDAATVTKAIGQ